MADNVKLILGLTLLSVLAQSPHGQDFYFDPAPLSQDVVEGTEILLRCDVSNRHLIMFKWEHNNRIITPTSRRFQEDSDLRILRVDRELDSGGFYCIAINMSTGLSITSREATLNILWINDTTSVQLFRPRESYEITSGTDVTLKCQCAGVPEPEAIWYRNSVRLYDNDRYRLAKSRLKISAVSPEDNGVYTCEASNKAGIGSSRGDGFILSVRGDGVPMLNTASFTSYALLPKGSTATLDCEFVGARLQEWLFNGRKVTTFSNKYSLLANGSLAIHDLQEADQGAYHCVGMGSGAVLQTYAGVIQLASLGDLTRDSFEPKPPTNGGPVVISIHDNYEIKCVGTDGLPTPQLHWLGPQGSAAPSSGRVSAPADVLSIADAVPADSGNYTCVVSNMAGEKKATVWIVVSEPPIITQSPVSVWVVEGDSTTFTCGVRATPFPVTRITWQRDGQPLKSFDPRIKINEATGEVTISDIQLTDAADYTCSVETIKQKTQLSVSAHLHVKKTLKFKPVPKSVEPIELNSVSHIVCNADGQPQPDIRWSRPGHLTLGANVSDVAGTLIFNRVQWAHSGNYTCTAVNVQGRIQQTVEVLVVIKPWFKLRPVNTTVAEGEPVMMHCVVDGKPPPRIEWHRSTHDSLDTRFQVLANGSLYVMSSQLADSGKYSCFAGNVGDIISEDVYLVVSTDQPSREEKQLVGSFDLMKTIIIAVCAAVAYLAIVIGLTVYCSIRLVRLKHAKTSTDREGKYENGSLVTERLMGNGLDLHAVDGRSDKTNDPLYDSLLLQPVAPSEDNRSHVSGVSSSHQSSGQSVSSSLWLKYSYPRHDLELLGLLGKGLYGDVIQATAHRIRNGEAETFVYVKLLTSHDQGHVMEFKREIELFARAKHNHVVQLLGICYDTEPQLMIMENLAWGDLKRFLLSSRKENTHTLKFPLPALTVAQMVSMCHQVAQAMEHLANLRLVHRDLAARNVLLDSHLHLKVANLSLSQDMYSNEYFTFPPKWIIPLRWMAPEALLDCEFTQRSDVWAFGCFVLEVFSLGDLPHGHSDEEEVIRCLGDPKASSPCRGPVQAQVPPEMWQIAQQCTRHFQLDRPAFSELCGRIGDLTIDTDI